MTSPRCPFASASVPRHLARGGGGLLAFCGSLVLLLHEGGPLGILGAVCAIAIAVVLLRGCPMCWVIGLVETAAFRASRSPHSIASRKRESP